MPRRSRQRGLVIAALTAVVSGIAVFVNGYGVRAWTNATAYTTVKNLIAGILIAVAILPVLKTLTLPRSRSVWGRLAVIGVLGGGIPFILFFEGLTVTTPAHAAFIHKSLVIWVALLALPLLGERLNRFHFMAIGFLFGGVALLGPVGGISWGRGESLILIATALWAIEVILVKRILPEVDATVAGAARLGFGAVVLFGWTVATGGLTAIAAASPAAWGWVAVTSGTLALFVVGWYSALALAPATDVTAMLVPAAAITALLSSGIRGAASPSPVGVIAMTIGLGALLAAGRRSARD